MKSVPSPVHCASVIEEGFRLEGAWRVITLAQSKSGSENLAILDRMFRAST